MSDAIIGVFVWLAFVVVLVLAGIGAARTRDALHVVNAVVAALMLALFVLHALRH